jgi:uncharacterized caspase-like protein
MRQGKRQRGCAIPLALMALVSAALGQPHASAADAGTRRALLIGINEYQAVPSLKGALNDVATARELLMTRWGFEAQHIRIVTDRAATRAGVLAAFEQLVRAAVPGDVVYVHYSGHGSQVRDLSGDEGDGLDETLVPHDGRTATVPDITDDELDSIVSRLRASAVLIVLDSCHSGTATRAFEIRTRSLPRDTREELYRQSVIVTRAIVPRMESQHVVMSGAAADQPALDGPVDGEYRGFFSYALSRSLAASGADVSPRSAFAGVEHELKRIQAQFGRHSMPEPQLEGPPALFDRPLLGTGSLLVASTAGSPRLSWLETNPERVGMVSLVNGVLLGAAQGSTWSIYAPGETSFLPGRALAVARVTDRSARDARATLEPATARIAPASRAVMLMPAPVASSVTIRIVDAPEPLYREIEAVLRSAIGNLQIVSSGMARFLIDPGGETVRLLTADGLQVLGTFDRTNARWGSELSRLVLRSTNASDLLTLDNPMSELRVSAQVAGEPMPALRDIVLAATHPAELRFRRPGEVRTSSNSLQLLISATKDAYLTIVSVDSEGSVHLLFPNDAQRRDFLPEGRVGARQPLLIPDSLEQGNRAGFFWDYGPPAGIDTIRIFASTDLDTARLIRERVRVLQPGATVTPGPGVSQHPVQRLDPLRRELTGLATRGIVLTADEPVAPGATVQSADWAAATVTVAIHE